ncbi:MAG: hypothetical protein HGA27_00975 [Peptococcaceae bacterium]|nr:hypothetical protein [Peptococcaceae bacterium]
MNYLQTILLVIVGSFFTFGGIYIFWGSRKYKDSVDIRERRGNLAGSIFLFIIGITLLTWGAFIGYSIVTSKSGQIVDKIPGNTKTTTSVVDNEESKEQPEKTPPSEVQQLTLKDDAEKSVEAFNQIQKKFDDIIEGYQTELLNINKGTIELSGSYDVDKLSQELSSLIKDLNNLEVPEQYTHYQELMLDSMLYLHSSLGDLRTCIVDKKFNLFNQSQDFFKKAVELNKIANIGIKNQATSEGYNPD